MAANAVIAMLDERHHQQVARLWREARAWFGLRDVFRTPYPHFSFHVADGYDLERIEDRLREMAGEIEPFRVRTSGIGIFTAADPLVIYVAMVRNAVLDRAHHRLWSSIDELASGSFPYYAPDAWVPHITLVHARLDARSLGAVVGWLGEQDLVWDAGVRALGLIRDHGTHQELGLCFDLGTGRAWTAEEREIARVSAGNEGLEP